MFSPDNVFGYFSHTSVDVDVVDVVDAGGVDAGGVDVGGVDVAASATCLLSWTALSQVLNNTENSVT